MYNPTQQQSDVPITAIFCLKRYNGSRLVNANLSKYGDEIHYREFCCQIREYFVCNHNTLTVRVVSYQINKVCNDFCPSEFSKMSFEHVKGQL